MEICLIEVERLLSEMGLKILNPDVLVLEEEMKIGIPETKQVRQFLSIKPIGKGTKAVVFMDLTKISHLAQNALLKTIEDEDNGVIIMIGTSKENIIATLLSRMETVTLATQINEQIDLDGVGEWVKGTVAERFKMIEGLDEKLEFFQQLAHFSVQHVSEGQIWVDFGKKVLQAERFWQANGNQRAILEWLALELSEGDRGQKL